MLTSERYNRATGMLMACPVTSRVKGYPLEIALPVGLEISGVILVHQARALDWQARKAVVIEAAPPQTVKAVLAALNTLLEEE